MSNNVELIGHYGGDRTHALSAWTSTLHEITPERKKRIGPLLKMLAENGHHTPFEKSMLHFSVRCDTASHIHLLKHRIGVSVNGESARYAELKDPTFYIPEDWTEEHQQRAVDLYRMIEGEYHSFVRQLERFLGRKRAKESARFLLPYANQLDLDVSFNFRSFAHFLSLRHKPDAQKEINDIADQMLWLVRGLDDFKLSLEAFGL